MAKTADVKWAQDPEEHDYPAAASYLGMLADADLIADVVARLASAPTGHQYAKDILRAAGLRLLPTDNPEVAKDLKKIADGVRLSPVLLVRGNISTGRRLEIADGYHRVCASYHVDEDTEIPCRLADLPE
jgi:hypothetical protein